MTKKGAFIVFEGGEGSGKDTLINLIKEKYANRDFVYARDPGGTPLGERIRELVLAKDASDTDMRAELLLFLAARAELTGKVIAPALSAGHTVIANRFTLSTIAYQIYGRKQLEYLEFVRSASHFADQGLVPDLCILLDVDPRTGLERATKRAGTLNRFDEEELAFHERVREGYKKHLAESAKKSVIVDTSGVIDDAWKKTEEVLQSLI